jgi:hypothetical protein
VLWPPPTGAYLTERFPPQIRYTGLPVSYHIGTGCSAGSPRSSPCP